MAGEQYRDRDESHRDKPLVFIAMLSAVAMAGVGPAIGGRIGILVGAVGITSVFGIALLLGIAEAGEDRRQA